MRIRLLLTILSPFGIIGTTSAAVAQEDVCDNFANTSHTRPSPISVEGATSHVYRSVDGTELRVHVYSPPGEPAKRRPAVVFLFGGGWKIGNVTDFASQAAYIASRGATAVLVDYRTFCRNGVQVDHQVSDAIDAVRWLRGNAGMLGIDPDRIALSGASSGGHLALSTAVFGPQEPGDGDPLPNLLVLFYPCVNLTNELEQEFSGAAIGNHGERLSPLFHIRGDLPPTTIIQGTADPLYDEVKSYCEAARAAGNDCEFVEYKDAAHGFFNAVRSPRSPWFDSGLLALDEALTRAGWLPERG